MCLRPAGSFRQYAEALNAMLCHAEELDFRRCGWTDDDAIRLAAVLPLCGRLKRLHLSQNRIGDVGMSHVAGALAAPALQALEVLALDNNEVGDTGGWELIRRVSLDDSAHATLPALKTLALANNELSDACVVGLTAALMAGALRACKKIELSGNAVTKANLALVRKALKKAK